MYYIPLPTPLTCVLASLLALGQWKMGRRKSRRRKKGRVSVWGGRTPLAPLLLSLFWTCQASGQGVMWKCGWLASTWLSLRTCLCREETPGLITPSPDTLLFFYSLSFSPYVFFLSLSPLRRCLSLSLLPLWDWKQLFFFSCPPNPAPFFFFADFCFPMFFSLSSLHPVCNWLFFCL